jgi:N-acetylneuraminic acid mutarotase/lysophospholipase L1-like esterase
MTYRVRFFEAFIVFTAIVSVASAEPAKVTIVAFGDSTTALRSTIKRVYAARLPETLKLNEVDARVINAGVGGSHTGHLSDNSRHKRRHALDRLDDAVRDHHPDFVVIQFGWNDSWVDSNQRDGASRISVQAYTANLKRIVSTLRSDGAEVILMTPNRPKTTLAEWRTERTAQYVDAMRNLAKQARVPLVDIWNEYERIEAGANSSSDSLLLDDLHPNDRGHEVVANLLSETITSLVKKNRWTPLPDLPDKFGFGGPIVGNHQDALIVAGGANFPHGPPWSVDGNPAGKKVWHDDIFVLLPGKSRWINAGKLPHPLAYAPAISTASGVYVLGGETFDKENHPSKEVLHLKWNSEKKRVTVSRNALTPLPRPCQYHNAEIINDVIYVTASHAKTATSQKLDSKSFWKLDLNQPTEKRKWQELPTWPGRAREKMAVAVQNATSMKSSHKCLYLFSGSTWYRDWENNYDLSRFEQFADAYRFDPATNEWTRLANLPPVRESREINLTGYTLETAGKTWRKIPAGEQQPAHRVNEIFKSVPRAAAAATATGHGRKHLLLFSGATGRYITLDIAQRPLFPREVLSYDIDQDRWRVVGRMPIGVVTTALAKWNNKIVIPSGEIRPGVRTNKVQAFDPSPIR